MAERLILETTFLIDLAREQRRSFAGPASGFLERHPDTQFLITFTVAGELAAGFSRSQRLAWEEQIAPFQVLGFSPDVAWQFGTAFRYLEDVGLGIGANDLWIAATALAHDLPLVTANEGHFKRVPGLEVISYRV